MFGAIVIVLNSGDVEIIGMVARMSYLFDVAWTSSADRNEHENKVMT